MGKETRNNSPEIIFDVSGHTAVITLNRPQRFNAITRPMLTELSRCLIECEKNDQVRAVILTGAGRGFCAGLDLVDTASDGIGSEEYLKTQVGLIDLRDTPPMVMHRMDKPLICALNGAAAGYGMDIALLADMRLASTQAKMAALPVKRGILPESGGAWLLPRLLGWAKAAELLFRARVLDAAQCLELGLVNVVVEPESLMDTALAWAAEICANAPIAVRATKRMMRLGADETFEAAVDHVYLQLLTLFRTQDYREGVAAFLEKREPRFEGR
ncbi:MAG: enoyl-CoA hydratase-related protein [Thermodesulfobacteriota bacterium]